MLATGEYINGALHSPRLQVMKKISNKSKGCRDVCLALKSNYSDNANYNVNVQHLYLVYGITPTLYTIKSDLTKAIIFGGKCSSFIDQKF